MHGGVISAILDLTGGLIATVELLKNIEGKDIEEVGRRIARVGTIDLRTDYLRAGKGEYFIATGATLRKGNKVAVVRTELSNNSNSLINIKPLPAKSFLRVEPLVRFTDLKFLNKYAAFV